MQLLFALLVTFMVVDLVAIGGWGSLVVGLVAFLSSLKIALWFSEFYWQFRHWLWERGGPRPDHLTGATGAPTHLTDDGGHSDGGGGC